MSSIQDIRRAIARRVVTTASGQWIRAVGYSEFDLLEGRHPTRWDLDQAAPDNPVRLNHRSGHACVLNSRALELVGISDSTLEPPGATILRDLTSGAPNGVLLEMDGFLDGKIPAPTRVELNSSVRTASQKLTSLGITAIQDATPSNSISRWETFVSLKSECLLSQRMTFMIGFEYVPEMLWSGLGFGAGDPSIRLGAAKVMVTDSGGGLHPDAVELRKIVHELHQQGFQVAIHAVESRAVSAAAEAIRLVNTLDSTVPESNLRHRIEHCSESPPEVLEQVASSGAIVVTQPGFVYSSGRRYMVEVSASDQPWLYRVGALRNSGVRVSFGSDAPVIDPNPMLGIYSAVNRKSKDGNIVAAEEAVGIHDALDAYTIGSAFAGHLESQLGVIRSGHLADLVLLDRDITATNPAELAETQVTHTIIGGSSVWNVEAN